MTANAACCSPFTHSHTPQQQ